MGREGMGGEGMEKKEHLLYPGNQFQRSIYLFPPIGDPFAHKYLPQKKTSILVHTSSGYSRISSLLVPVGSLSVLIQNSTVQAAVIFVISILKK